MLKERLIVKVTWIRMYILSFNHQTAEEIFKLLTHSNKKQKIKIKRYSFVLDKWKILLLDTPRNQEKLKKLKNKIKKYGDKLVIEPKRKIKSRIKKQKIRI